MLEAKDIISFAAGAPSPDQFPNDELADIAQDLLKNNCATSLQYGVTEGYTPLRNAVKERLTKQGAVSDGDDVIIVTGGQQGLDLAAKVLLDDHEGSPDSHRYYIEYFDRD